MCQYFKCEVRVGITAQMHWNWLLFKQENKFQENNLNFSQNFCQILSQNREFDFDKEKLQMR